MNPKALSDFSQLALAAYYSLNSGVPSEPVLQDNGKGFSVKQSERFSSLYTVVLPTYSDPVSDLDVTVFKDADGNLTLGIRGTLL